MFEWAPSTVRATDPKKQWFWFLCKAAERLGYTPGQEERYEADITTVWFSGTMRTPIVAITYDWIEDELKITITAGIIEHEEPIKSLDMLWLVIMTLAELNKVPCQGTYGDAVICRNTTFTLQYGPEPYYDIKEISIT